MDFPNSFVVIAALVTFCFWFFAMLINERFRIISNEVWGHYGIHALKFGWPYAIVYFLYRVIEDGTLGATLRAAFH